MNRFTKLARNPWLLAFLAALTLYTLLGFFLIPYGIRHYGPRLAADKLQRQLSLGEVRFNPFLFTFEANDFVFKEADGKPIAGFKRLFVDFEPTNLTRRTWTFADFRLDNPSVDLVLDREGKTNFARIAESLPSSEPPPPPSNEPPPRIVVNRVALVKGAARFTDLANPSPLTETVEPIDLELKDLSTLPDQRGNYTIDAILPEGAKLHWRGEVSLNPLASSGEASLESLRLATLWRFVRERLNLAEPGGEIGLAARYRFSQREGKTELAVEEGSATLKKLRLAAADAAEPLLSLEEIGFSGASFDLAGRTIRVPSVIVRDGRIRAEVNGTGELNWLKLSKPAPANANPRPVPAAPQPAEPASPPWRAKVEEFKIAGIGIAYADASRTAPFVVSIGEFGLGLAAEAEVGAGKPKALIDRLNIKLNRVALAEAGKAATVFGWDSFSVEGGQLDLEKQAASVKLASLAGGGTSIVREADGTIHPLDLFAPKPTRNQPSGATPTEAKSAEVGQPWRFSLDEFDLRGFRLGLTDRGTPAEIAYSLADIGVTLKHIASAGNNPVSFDIRTRIGQGNLQATGTAAPKGDAARAKVKLDRFDLKPLQPLVSRFAALELKGAELSANLDVDFRQGAAGPAAKATGGLGLNGLLLNETKSGKRFLGWKSLVVDGIDFSLAPDKLAVKEVRILEPGANIEIFKDRSTNIAAIFKPQAPATKPAAKPDKPKAGAAKPAAGQPFPVSVERVRIDDGNIDFSDISLVIPFATHIHDFDGSATGISTAASAKVALKFEGRVEEYGQAKVDGSLIPTRIKDYSDVSVVFRNVAMSSLSPYSATFAGRKIQSGKLNLDLRYRVEERRLKSENKIVLEQFTLGEAVESPGATSLPLDLAIALLTDSDGKINAAIPIEGDVDNPQFSYGTLVWDAFVTLVKTTVMAPFNAIASVFGGDTENFGDIIHEPGSDRIPPPEREKLAKVAEALVQRPKLKLTVHGRFDPKLDGEALKSLQVRLLLAKKQEIELKPGEDPGEVGFGGAKTQQALEALAVEKGGPAAVDAFQAEYEKAGGKKIKRVGAVGGLLGRASEDADFYEKLFRHLVDTAPLKQDELDGLARRRGKAVMAELAGRPGIDRARIADGAMEQVADSGEGNVASRLELAAD